MGVIDRVSRSIATGDVAMRDGDVTVEAQRLLRSEAPWLGADALGSVVDNILGFGPVQPLLDDQEVTLSSSVAAMGAALGAGRPASLHSPTSWRTASYSRTGVRIRSCDPWLNATWKKSLRYWNILVRLPTDYNETCLGFHRRLHRAVVGYRSHEVAQENHDLLAFAVDSLLAHFSQQDASADG